MDDQFVVITDNSECDVFFEEPMEKPVELLMEKPQYDEMTRETYRVLRLTRRDPITHEVVTEGNAFEFPYRWDPYTGERFDKDPDGPLCFDPDILVHHFWVNRLNKLWELPTTVYREGAIYEGYFDDGVGLGEDFHIPGRGDHPEWYIFRLPICDCYLTEDHNLQHITMGPKLTDEEIKDIDAKSKQQGHNYFRLFGKERPSVKEMKDLYDIAISKDPCLHIGVDTNGKTEREIKHINNELNHQAIKKLLVM